MARPIDQDSLLTLEEQEVLAHLREAYNKFNALPVQHPMHGQEFTSRLHDLQRMIMARPVEREWGLPAMVLLKIKQGQTIPVRYERDSDASADNVEA